MSLLRRVATLERQHAGATDAEVRARCEDLARRYDLPFDEVYAITRHYLRIGPDAALRELAAELSVSVEEAERDVMAVMEGRS